MKRKLILLIICLTFQTAIFAQTHDALFALKNMPGESEITEGTKLGTGSPGSVWYKKAAFAGYIVENSRKSFLQFDNNSHAKKLIS